jgi:hypothetical protein
MVRYSGQRNKYCESGGAHASHARVPQHLLTARGDQHDVARNYQERGVGVDLSGDAKCESVRDPYLSHEGRKYPCAHGDADGPGAVYAHRLRYTLEDCEEGSDNAEREGQARSCEKHGTFLVARSWRLKRNEELKN